MVSADELLNNSIRPVVLTLATEQAELLCQKNGLTFDKLLSGFSVVTGLNVPFRSVAGTSQQLREFRVSFRRSSESRFRPVSAATPLLTTAFHPSLSEAETFAPDPVKDVAELVAKGSGKMPWLSRFRTVLTRSLQYQEASQLEAPCLCVLAASTSDQDPLAAFHELSQMQWMPTPFRDGQFDPGLQRYFVLFHDPYVAPQADPNALMALMMSRFPHANCKVLALNSLPPDAPNPNNAGLWDKSSGDPVFFPEDLPSSGGAVSTELGCCLSEEDVEGLRGLVQDIVKGGVIPQMERRIFTLNANITNNRKGVKNAIKMWWRKPREEERPQSPGAPKGCQYKYNSIETQLRLLADTLFIMKDYETALATYKLARDDFKADKAYLHYAMASEMCALCLFLCQDIETSKRDVQSYIEAASLAYRKHLEENFGLSPTPSLPLAVSEAGPHPTASNGIRMCTQLSFLWADLCLAMGETSTEAIQNLVHAASYEDALCSGVLLEKAAWLYLNSGYTRKFAFYLTMAAIRYQKCDQDWHATRCLSLTDPVYHTPLNPQSSSAGGQEKMEKENFEDGWARISSHVQSTLALQLSQNDKQDAAEALSLLVQLLGSSFLGPTRQVEVISGFLELCRKNPEAVQVAVQGNTQGEVTAPESTPTAPMPLIPLGEGRHPPVVPGLLLPKVKEGTVAMVSSGTQLLSSSTAPTSEKDWEELADDIEKEEDLSLRHATGQGCWSALISDPEGVNQPPRSQQMNAYLKQQALRGKPLVRARGEPITVSLVVENPMAVAVSVEALQLRVKVVQPCTRETETPLDLDQLVVDLRAMKCEMETPDSHPEFDSEKSGLSYLVEKQKVELLPGEQKHVRLRTCFLVPGVLQIIGIRWKLFGEVWGLHDFKLKGPLLQNNLENRAKKNRAPNLSLHSQVVGDMPWLHCELTGLGEEVLQGEVVRCKLVLENRGRVAAGDCLLKASLPWLAFTQQESSDLYEASSCCVGPSATLFRPFADVLAPGAKVELPVWVRPQGGGKQSLKMLIRYRRADMPKMKPASKGSFGAESVIDQWERTLRMEKEVCVLPSLAISTSVHPSYNRKDEYVLSLEITNYRSDGQQRDRDLIVHKVCGVSRFWSLEPLAELKSTDASSIDAGSVGWQERLTLHYRLIPRAVDPFLPPLPEDLYSERTVVNLPPDNGEWRPQSQFLCIDYAAAQHQIAKEAEKQRLASMELEANSSVPRTIQGIRRENLQQQQQQKGQTMPLEEKHEDKEDPHPTSVLALSPKEASIVNLMVIWGRRPNPHDNGHYQSTQRRGQHHKTQLTIRPKSLEQHCPLIMTLSYPPSVNHSFEDGKPCEVEVLVNVTNRLCGEEHSKVDFTFQALSENFSKMGSSSGAEFGARNNLQNAFIWHGSTRRTIQDLHSGSNVTIPLRACFFSAGMYDLNRFRFIVQFSRSKPTIFVFPAQYLLSINSSGPSFTPSSFEE